MVKKAGFWFVKVSFVVKTKAFVGSEDSELRGLSVWTGKKVKFEAEGARDTDQWEYGGGWYLSPHVIVWAMDGFGDVNVEKLFVSFLLETHEYI